MSFRGGCSDSPGGGQSGIQTLRVQEPLLPGLRTCHRPEAGRAWVPRETTSVTPDCLRAPPPLSILCSLHPSLCICLTLPASLVFLSFSPLPLPLCRDPWRSPMAWTCPTRARSTPSTSARSARCLVTTAAGCSEPAHHARSHPPSGRRGRHSLCLSSLPCVLQPYTPGRGCLRFSSHVCCQTVLWTWLPPPNAGALCRWAWGLCGGDRGKQRSAPRTP